MWRLFLLLTAFIASVTSHGHDHHREEVSERYKEQSSAVGFALAPNMSIWEQLLLPSPTVVTLIGQMVVHSSEIDVSLESDPPEGGWKHVHRPNSLRGSLLQVGNEAWEVFNTAQSKMDHVGALMLHVPRHVRSAVHVISTMEPATIPAFLAIPLDHIDKICQESAKMTGEISRAFVKVMGLTAELSESVGAKEGKTDVMLVEKQAKLESGKTEQEIMKEQENRMQKNYKKQAKVLSDARGRYEKAFDAIPTDWKPMAVEMMHSLVPTLVSTIALVKSPLAGVGLSALTSTPKFVHEINPREQNTESQELAKSNVFDPIILQSVKVMAKRIPVMAKVLEEVDVDNSLDSVSPFRAISSILDIQTSLMHSFPNSDIKQKALGLMNRVKSVASIMTEKLSGLDSLTPEEINGHLDTMKSFGGDIITLESAAQAAGLDLGMSSPTESGTDEAVIRNERAKVSMELATLKQYEYQQRRMFSDLIKFNEKLAELELQVERMAKEKLNLKVIRAILRQVLRMLGELRQRWSNLAEYFRLVAVRARVLHEQYLIVFSEFSEQLDEEHETEMRRMMVHQLGRQTADIQVVCFYFHKFAETYKRISNRHLTGAVAGVAKLLSPKTEEKRRALLTKLTKENEEARAAIMGIIKETRETYDTELEDRLAKTKDHADSLGQPTQTELDHILAGRRLLENNEVKP